MKLGIRLPCYADDTSIVSDGTLSGIEMERALKWRFDKKFRIEDHGVGAKSDHFTFFLGVDDGATGLREEVI